MIILNMLKDDSKLWDFLNEYCISKFSFHIQEKRSQMSKSASFINGKFVEDVEPSFIEKGTINFSLDGSIQKHLIFSQFFTIFTTNINRAIALYPEIIKISQPEEFFNIKNIFIFQTMQIHLITALEVYLSGLFLWVANNNVLISHLDPKLFIKFLKTFNLKNQFLDKFAEKGNLDFFLGEILPERIDASVFQQKRKCKIAFKLIGIDVVNIEESIWEKIYTSENGYITKRNLCVHSDIHDYLGIKNIYDFDLKQVFEVLENTIMDIVKFVYYIEHQRFFKFPDMVETSTGQLDNFNYREMNPLIKEVLVNNNIENILLFASYLLKEGNYIKAIDILEVICEVKPNYAEFWYRLGEAYEYINEVEKAKEAYEKAYEIKPNYENLKKS